MLRASPFHRIPELLTSSARLFTLHTCPRVARALKLPLISGYWGAGTPTCGIRPPLTHTRYCALQSASKGYAPCVYIKDSALTNLFLYTRGFGSESARLYRDTTLGRISSFMGTSKPCDRARRCYHTLVSQSDRATPTQARSHSVIHELDETPRGGCQSHPRPGSQASGNSIGSAILPLHSFDVGGGLTGSPIGLSLLTSADPAQVKLPSRPTVARSTSAPASQSGMHYWPCGSQNRDPEWDRSGRRLHDHSLVRMCSI